MLKILGHGRYFLQLYLNFNENGLTFVKPYRDNRDYMPRPFSEQ